MGALIGTWPTLRGLLAAALLGAPSPQDAGDLLHGRVRTVGGEVHSGFIRWDGRGAAWADFLGGSKEVPVEHVEQVRRLRAESESPGAREARAIEFMGVRITWDEDDGEDEADSAASGVRFGHLRGLTVTGDRSARLALKSGVEVELTGTSRDLGDGVRGIVVHALDGGEVELSWRDLESIEFTAVPPGATAPGSRLHGTLRDRRGDVYTGYLAWDLEKVSTTDVLVGREGDRERRIAFGDVSGIERTGSSSARVTLANGETVALRGTADVGAGHHGVRVTDPSLGDVMVSWRDVRDVRLHPPGRPSGYEAFDGGRPLRGTVTTRDGEHHAGRIRWDNDEEHTWELLNGRREGVVFAVELRSVREIRRLTPRSAAVTLTDGRSLELSGSNDVGWGHRGLVLQRDDGSFRLVEWVDVREVTFDTP